MCFNQLALERALFVVSISIDARPIQIEIPNPEQDTKTIKTSVFKWLPTLRNQLTHRRSVIYALTRGRRYRFLPAENLSAFYDELQGLRTFADNLFQKEVISKYDQEHQDFLTFLENQKSIKWAELFPERDDIVDVFGVRLHDFRIVPGVSLENLSREQQEAFEQLKTLQDEEIHQNLAIAAQEAREDVDRLTEEILATIRNIKDPQRLHSKIGKRLENLQTLVSTTFWVSHSRFSTESEELSRRVERTKSLIKTAIGGSSKEELLHQMNEFRW